MKRILLLAAWVASSAVAGPLEVSVPSEGKVHVLGDEKQPENLQKRFQEYAHAEQAAERVPEIVIDCAADATIRALFDVLLAGAAAGISDYRIKVGDVAAPLALPKDKGLVLEQPGGAVPIPDDVRVQVCSSLNREEHSKEWGAHAKGVPAGTPAKGASAWIGSAADTAKDLSEEGAEKEVAGRVAADVKREQAKAAKGDVASPILYVDPDVRVELWHRLLVELQVAGVPNPELAALPE
jgi:hypothetical protein